MGAGCHYTLAESDEKAYWIDIYCGCEDLCDCSEYVRNQLSEELYKLSLCVFYDEVPSTREYADELYYGKMFIISLESTYYGDGIVINLKYQLDFEHEGLQEYNYSRCYDKIIKHLLTAGYHLNIASSEYMSETITKENSWLFS